MKQVIVAAIAVDIAVEADAVVVVAADAAIVAVTAADVDNIGAGAA